MRTEFKIKSGSIDPVKLAEEIENIGTHYRLITDGDPMDLTSPFMAAMLFTSDDVHSLFVAADQSSLEAGKWKKGLAPSATNPNWMNKTIDNQCR